MYLGKLRGLDVFRHRILKNLLELMLSYICSLTLEMYHGFLQFTQRFVFLTTVFSLFLVPIATIHTLILLFPVRTTTTSHIIVSTTTEVILNRTLEANVASVAIHLSPGNAMMPKRRHDA